MSTIGYNTRADVQQLRDSFFSQGMKEYYEELMSNEQEVKMAIEMLLKYAKGCKNTDQIVDRLYRRAKKLIDDIEMGRVKEKDLDAVEKEIAHCLYCIIDAQKVLQLERTPDYDDNTMSR